MKKIKIQFLLIFFIYLFIYIYSTDLHICFFSIYLSTYLYLSLSLYLSHCIFVSCISFCNLFIYIYPFILQHWSNPFARLPNPPLGKTCYHSVNHHHHLLIPPPL